MDGQLAVVRTNGPSIVGSVHSSTLPFRSMNHFRQNFPLGRTAEDVGSVAGNTLRKIGLNLPATVLSTVPPGSSSFSSACCNEQMVVFKGNLYHAHWSDVIQQLTIDASGNSEVTQTYTQDSVVGMASDGAKIWIPSGANSRWEPGSHN